VTGLILSVGLVPPVPVLPPPSFLQPGKRMSVMYGSVVKICRRKRLADLVPIDTFYDLSNYENLCCSETLFIIILPILSYL
jgi:hypothetical protein